MIPRYHWRTVPPGRLLAMALTAAFAMVANAQQNCLVTSAEQMTCDDAVASRYHVTFNIENRATVPVRYLLIVAATNCAVFHPVVITFDPALPVGAVAAIQTTAEFACGRAASVRQAALDAALKECCSVVKTFGQGSLPPRIQIEHTNNQVVLRWNVCGWNLE